MDTVMYVRGAAALALVLGLILGMLWLMRRFNLGGMGGRAPARRRLSVVESLVLDNRHRLVLISREGRQHLLLLGTTADLVVESNIVVERRERPAAQALEKDKDKA